MKSLLARFAVAALLSAGVVAVPASATAHESCETPEDVPVVLEFGSLEGEDRILCAQHSAGKTGLDALADAGVETEMSSGAMAMVCRIDELPTPADEKCGNALNGPGYWAFMVAEQDQDWGYASVGLQEYKLAAGDFVALKYHLMADGENVEVQAAPDAQTRADAVVPGAEDHGAEDHGDSAEHAASDDSADASSFAEIALPIAVVAALLVAAAAFVVARRRRV